MNIKKDDGSHISIGGLAKATGVPVETLRNWERRYGFPEPLRRESGHRRYALEIVPHLKLIKSAIGLGFKPSFVVQAKPDELTQLIADQKEQHRLNRGPLLGEETVESTLKRWMSHLEALDATALEDGLRRAWVQYGAEFSILKLLVPFLRQVGDRWAEGSLTVAHEHFASEVIVSFLTRQWRPLSQRATGPRVVLAALEGELHCLGLHMAAVFLALAGDQVIFLGANTPLDDIVKASNSPTITALVIGLSAATQLDEAVYRLKTLQQRLPDKVVMVIGGHDPLPEIEGVTGILTLDAFSDWVRTL